MTQQNPDLNRITNLLNQSTEGLPKGEPSKPPKAPSNWSCLVSLQSCLIRIMALMAIVSLSIALGAILVLWLVPPSFHLSAPPIIITAKPMVVTQSVQVIVTAEPLVITQTIQSITTTEPIITVPVDLQQKEPINIHGITVTLEGYANEVFISFNQQTYIFSLKSPAMSQKGEYGLIIKNDYHTQKSSFAFVAGGGANTIAQISEMTKINEIAIQLVHQYAKFELE